MSDITLQQAQAAVDAALEKSQELGVKMDIAVVDAGANLKAFVRMDGAWLGSIDIAIKKAKTARFFDMDTGEIGKLSQPGAKGGHGPIRYFVKSYEPGRNVYFEFTAPAGFDGFHGFELEEIDPDSTVLRHVLEMKAAGPALFTWSLVFRPLHDALLEDALDKAERNLGCTPAGASWSAWVKILRWILRKIQSRGGSRK